VAQEVSPEDRSQRDTVEEYQPSLFLDVVIKKELAMITKVYRKPTRTGRYLLFEVNHPLHAKRGTVQSLQSRDSTICQEKQDLLHEIDNLRQDHQLSGYPPRFTDSAFNSRENSCLREGKKPLGVVFIPCVKVISGNFKHTGNRYKIKTIFKIRHTLWSLIMKIKPEKVLQQTIHCIYSIPFECRNYIDETGRLLAV
jgi:hypothetical protein